MRFCSSQTDEDHRYEAGDVRCLLRLFLDTGAALEPGAWSVAVTDGKYDVYDCVVRWFQGSNKKKPFRDHEGRLDFSLLDKIKVMRDIVLLLACFASGLVVADDMKWILEKQER